MQRANKGVLLIGFVLFAIVILVFILSSLSSESDQDLYLRDVQEVETVTSKLIDSNFQQELITELKNEGYKPTGSIAYTIYSMDEKELTIVLHGIDTSRKKAEKYIQQLTNQLSTSSGLGTFEVKVLEDKD
ncbi:hypothetical protein ACFPYN_07920 [Paenisporosarcina macmurdoensis]|uniref:DUF3679 domain-containing protein n=1 Tax=Paenisporosarcina macmurdoensis TaxID=212659 RepID=A0ABW1L830_9BACL